MIDDLVLLQRLGTALDVRTAAAGGGEGSSVRDLLIETLLKVRSKRSGPGSFDAEPGAADLLATMQPAKYCVEGAASGHYDLHRRAILCADDHAAGNIDGASRPRPGVGGRHFQDRASLLGQPAGRDEEGSAADIAGQCPPVGLSALDSEYRVATAADCSAGRGTTIHHLHCSEVARWPHDAEETLTSLRAAVPQSGEVVIESTPNGAGGPFYEEWQRAEETGYTQAFLPLVV